MVFTHSLCGKLLGELSQIYPNEIQLDLPFDLVKEAYSLLPEAYRYRLKQRFQHGMTLDELGEELAITRSAVHYAINHGLELLKNAIKFVMARDGIPSAFLNYPVVLTSLPKQLRTRLLENDHSTVQALKDGWGVKGVSLEGLTERDNKNVTGFLYALSELETN